MNFKKKINLLVMVVHLGRRIVVLHYNYIDCQGQVVALVVNRNYMSLVNSQCFQSNRLKLDRVLDHCRCQHHCY